VRAAILAHDGQGAARASVRVMGMAEQNFMIRFVNSI